MKNGKRKMLPIGAVVLFAFSMFSLFGVAVYSSTVVNTDLFVYSISDGGREMIALKPITALFLAVCCLTPLTIALVYYREYFTGGK